MIEKKDVLKLASLARLTIPENEIEKVRKDLESILAYVDQVKEAGDSNKNKEELSPEFNYDSGVKNVFREDGPAHEPGIYTDALLDRAPKTSDDYIEVKKILQ